MKDADLIAFATEFRDGILDGQPSVLRCAMVAWPLAGLLRLHGVACDTEEVDLQHCNHVFIRLADGRVLDPTADQFNDVETPGARQWPPVYLGEATDFHRSPSAPG